MKRSSQFFSLAVVIAVGLLLSSHTAHAYSAFPDPLNNADVPILINRIVTAVLGIVGSLFFVMFLWGGFQYMTAGGDAGKVKNGRTTLLNAVIGIALVAFSYVITGYVAAWIWIGSNGNPTFDQPEDSIPAEGTPTGQNTLPTDFSTPN
ncbi:MAG: pilin [Patescibacteria group bacterium]